MLSALLQQLCRSSTCMPDSTAAWVPVPQSQRSSGALQHGKADIIAAHNHPGIALALLDVALMDFASGRLTWTGPSNSAALLAPQHLVAL